MEGVTVCRAATEPVPKNPLRAATMSLRPLPGVRRAELAQEQATDLPADLIARPFARPFVRPFVRAVPLKGARGYSSPRNNARL